MAHNLVKLLVNGDGEPIKNGVWHYVANWGDTNRTLCTGESFEYGGGEASGAIKVAQKGVPCLECKKIIQQMKRVKL